VSLELEIVERKQEVNCAQDDLSKVQQELQDTRDKLASVEDSITELQEIQSAEKAAKDQLQNDLSSLAEQLGEQVQKTSLAEKQAAIL
jgi:chromosome segregation ATPase